MANLQVPDDGRIPRPAIPHNVTVEEARGNADGREYHGLVYSATDNAGNKVSNPFKASRIGKSVGYEAVRRRLNLQGPHPRQASGGHDAQDRRCRARPDYRKEEFIDLLQCKGCGCGVPPNGRGAHLRGNLHRPPHGLRGERLTAWAESFLPTPAGAFTLPYAGTPPIPFRIRRTSRRKIPSMRNTLRGIHRLGPLAMRRAHRRRKPPSSVTSNARRRNAARVWAVIYPSQGIGDEVGLHPTSGPASCTMKSG